MKRIMFLLALLLVSFLFYLGMNPKRPATTTEPALVETSVSIGVVEATNASTAIKIDLTSNGYGGWTLPCPLAWLQDLCESPLKFGTKVSASFPVWSATLSYPTDGYAELAFNITANDQITKAYIILIPVGNCVSGSKVNPDNSISAC